MVARLVSVLHADTPNACGSNTTAEVAHIHNLVVFSVTCIISIACVYLLVIVVKLII